MSHETLVLTVSPTQAAGIEARLRDELPPNAEWRNTPHARFSVKAFDAIVTCYKSGKLVVQGSELDSFVMRFLDGLPAAATTSAKKPGDVDLPFDTVTIGSDETGKGDYFGPLIVASVRATPDDAEWLGAIGVTDSKNLADDRARRLAGQLEERLDFEISRLEPADYNRAHATTPNVNVLLGALHARAIGALLRRHDDVGLVIVDRFADERHVLDPLRGLGVTVPRVLQVPRAERHPVVAAASIVARAAFLEGLAACSDACGTDLHKGAGEPTDASARRVFAIGGRALLATVAKLHFKNTARAEQNR